MKTTILFDPSQGTSNLGDLIIRRAIDRELASVFSNNFVVRYGTHTPLATLGMFLRGKRNQIIANCLAADQKFICGTNIIKESLLHLNSDWVVGPLSAKLYSGAVLIGAGMSGNPPQRIDSYTKQMYRKILSFEYTHSVRDTRAAEFLRHLGFKAINTGCPTTWKLLRENQESTFVKQKPKSVVFTITDYAPDHNSDKSMIQTLFEEYEEVWFWPQGIGDVAYAKKLLAQQPGVRWIDPTLEAYTEFLISNDCDFIGTRLHGGILAQELGHRTIIISVDNRARDMAVSAPIVCIERNSNSKIKDLINEWPVPSSSIDETASEIWLQQFLP